MLRLHVSCKRKPEHAEPLRRLFQGSSCRAGYHSQAQTRVLEDLDRRPQDDFTRLLRAQINGTHSVSKKGRPRFLGQRSDSDYSGCRATSAFGSRPLDPSATSDLVEIPPGLPSVKSNLKNANIHIEEAITADAEKDAAVQGAPGQHPQSTALSTVEAFKHVRRCTIRNSSRPLIRYPLSNSHELTTAAGTRTLSGRPSNDFTFLSPSKTTPIPTTPISYYDCTDTGLFTSTGVRIHGAECLRKSTGVTPFNDTSAASQVERQVADIVEDIAVRLRFHLVNDPPQRPIDHTHNDSGIKISKLARKPIPGHLSSRKTGHFRRLRKPAQKLSHMRSSRRETDSAVETGVSFVSISSNNRPINRKYGRRRNTRKAIVRKAPSLDVGTVSDRPTMDQTMCPVSSDQSPGPLANDFEDIILNSELDAVLESYRELSNTGHGGSIHHMPISAPPIRRMRSALTSSASMGNDFINSPFWRNHSLQGSRFTKSRHMSVSAHKAAHTLDLARSQSIVDDVGQASRRKLTIRERLRLWESVTEPENRVQPPFSQTASADSSSDVLGFRDHENILEDEDDLYDDDDLLETEQLGTYLTDDISRQQHFGNPPVPGDLTAWGRAQDGDLLRLLISVEDNKGYFYSEHGYLIVTSLLNVKFSVARFEGRKALSKLLPYVQLLKEKDGDQSLAVPRDVSGTIISKMLRFREAADACFREYANRIGSAYDILAPPGDQESRTISLGSAARQILQKNNQEVLTAPMLWAVDRALRRTQYIFTGPDHREFQEFTISPRNHSERLEQVKNWVQAYQEDAIQNRLKSYASANDHRLDVNSNPLPGFLMKVRRIVQSHRRDRPLLASRIGPGLTNPELHEGGGSTWKAVEAGELFNMEEQKILELLTAWAVMKVLQTASPLTAIGPVILRATGLYDGTEFGRETAFTLLQELGILKPWDRADSFNMRSVLPTRAHYGDSSNNRLGVGDHDSMGKQRKDWADLAVFCIDGEQTLERDDGISLEPDGDDVSMHWLHIHIANPTAFIEHDSPTANYAAALGQSVYFPEQRYPMVDPDLSQDRFSLQDGCPSITVSIKVANTGEVVEKQISHGIVHNVQNITPEEVQHHVFGEPLYSERSERDLLRVGTPIAVPISQYQPRTVLEPSHVETLRKIIAISMKMQKYQQDILTRDREHEFATVRDLPSSCSNYKDTISVHVHGSPSSSGPPIIDLSRSCQFVGDPVITIRRGVQRNTSATKMIANLMVIASSTVASWCSDRGIPIPYRGYERNPRPWCDPAGYAKTYIEPSLRTGAAIDRKHLQTYLRLFGHIRQSSSPLEHLTIGVSAYCRATSPLRRYTDMVTHWQLEAALRHEHENNISLVGVDPSFYDDRAILPWSRDDIEAIAEKAHRQERKIQYAYRTAKQQWVAQALARALFFEEPPMENSFHVKIHPLESVMSRLGANGRLEVWDYPVIVLPNKSIEALGGLRIGDVWKGSLTCIRPYWRDMIFDAKELVRRSAGEEDRGVPGEDVVPDVSVADPVSDGMLARTATSG